MQINTLHYILTKPTVGDDPNYWKIISNVIHGLALYM